MWLFTVGEALESDVDLMRRFGGPISHAALLSSCQIFRVAGIEGLLGFRVHHGHAVVLGDPVANEVHWKTLYEVFLTYAAEQGLSVIFVVVSKRFVDLALGDFACAMQFGELLVGNPGEDPEKGARGGHLRTSVRYPQRMGVTIRSYESAGPIDPALEARVLRATAEWRARRKGFQLHIGSHRFFENRGGCRLFIAEHEGQVVGVLSLIKIGSAGCQYLIDLVFSTPSAPTHTNEFLIVSAYSQLRLEGVDRVCLGVAPSGELSDMIGFGAWRAFLARGFYALANRLVPQYGKIFFWKKFGILRSDPLYLLFQDERIGIQTFRALLKAFNFSSENIRKEQV